MNFEYVPFNNVILFILNNNEIRRNFQCVFSSISRFYPSGELWKSQILEEFMIPQPYYQTKYQWNLWGHILKTIKPNTCGIDGIISLNQTKYLWKLWCHILKTIKLNTCGIDGAISMCNLAKITRRDIFGEVIELINTVLDLQYYKGRHSLKYIFIPLP